MKHILLLPAIALPMVLLMLCGCAEVKAPQTHYYLLAAPSTYCGEFNTTPIPVRVELAQFLNQGTLVIQLDEQRIRSGHYHRWGEPLPGLIERYVQRRLQQKQVELGNTTSLTLVVDRFHGSQHGDIWFSGQWWSNSAKARPHSFNDQIKQQQPGYKGLVTTLQQLLDTACIDMATQLHATTAGKH